MYGVVAKLYYSLGVELKLLNIKSCGIFINPTTVICELANENRKLFYLGNEIR